MYNSPRGPAGVLLTVLTLVVGIIAFIGIYGMNFSQNLEIANSVGNSITNNTRQSAASEDISLEVAEQEQIQAYLTQAHARRHDKYVADIPDKCNSSSFQVHMHRNSDNRDAYLCLIEGYFVISIFNFTQEMIDKWGDTEVTAFSRPAAQTMQDVIDYMASKGYTVVP